MIDFVSGAVVQPPIGPVIFWDYELVSPAGVVRHRTILGPRTRQAAESRLAAMLASTLDTYRNLTERRENLH